MTLNSFCTQFQTSLLSPLKYFKCFIGITLLITANSHAQNSTFYVSPGAVLTAQSTTLLTLKNVHFKTDGTVNADNSTILLIGDEITNIGGTQKPVIGTLQIDKPTPLPSYSW